MKTTSKTPIVKIRCEVLVSAHDADDVIHELTDAFLNSDASQFRNSPPHTVGYMKSVSVDCMCTLYPEYIEETG